MKKKKTMKSQAEKFSGRRREILRTERRISPDGARTRPARGMTGEYEYVVNPYGLRIKVCCASCHWKQLTESLVTRKCRRLKKRVKPRHCCGFWGMSDGINTIAGEAVGNFAEAAQQLKLKVGGWVQVSLEFSVNDRKTQDGRDFKAQRVRIINISPLWGHEETADKAF